VPVEEVVVVDEVLAVVDDEVLVEELALEVDDDVVVGPAPPEPLAVGVPLVPPAPPEPVVLPGLAGAEEQAATRARAGMRRRTSRVYQPSSCAGARGARGASPRSQAFGADGMKKGQQTFACWPQRIPGGVLLSH
jgi:hypothetical protein